MNREHTYFKEETRSLEVCRAGLAADYSISARHRGVFSIFLRAVSCQCHASSFFKLIRKNVRLIYVCFIAEHAPPTPTLPIGQPHLPLPPQSGQPHPPPPASGDSKAHVLS